MDFVNESPFQAEIIRSALSTDDTEPILAAVILKVTYEISSDGSVFLADEQLPIRKMPEETDFGPLPMDTAPTKPNVDLFVFGTVQPLSKKSLTKTNVYLRVGDQTRTLAIFGDRRWIRENGTLTISKPEPIDQLSLSYEYAYGGKAKALDYEISNVYNPAGKGYILQKEHAEGVSLPNIEDPEFLIQSWEDQPAPAGFAPVPLSSMFTVDRGILFNKDKNSQEIKPDVFQNAHPRLVFPSLPSGTKISLEGMNPEGPITFKVPDLRVTVKVRLENRTYFPEGKIDTLCLLADEHRFYMLHRTSFKYPFVPEQTRITHLDVENHGGFER